MNKVFTPAKFLFLIIGFGMLSCSKIISGPKKEVNWIYSKLYRYCDDDAFLEFIYPGDTLGINSARLIRSGSKESDNIVFHFYLNDQLVSVQRFTDYNEISGGFLNQPDGNTITRYFGNKLDEDAELIFSLWSDSGGPEHGFYFSTEFPFNRRFGTPPCDSLIINFFKSVD